MATNRLLLELGRGGMGTVYLAVTEGPGGFTKLKVVKTLREDMAENVQLVQMFMEEARLSARLNHPNIVQTNEVGFDGRHHFIEMEYLEGQSLASLSRRATNHGDFGPNGLPLLDSVWILVQVLAALHYAHTLADVKKRPLHIVHRDVSPHNIFITYEGAVKLVDFGIAKAADSTFDTATGIVKGKITYMAPEQAARRPVDGRADIFAVGVILWQMLTGQRMWPGMSDFEIFTRLEAGDLPSPRTVAPLVHPVLDAICVKSLAKAPNDRYATAAEMQTALESWLESMPERPGPKRLGKIMNDLFADRREIIREEVEAQLLHATRSGAVAPKAEQVPLLGNAKGFAATRTGREPKDSRSDADDQETEERPLGGLEAASVPDGDNDRTRTTPAMVSEPPPKRPRLRAASLLALLGVSVCAVGAVFAIRAVGASRVPAEAASSGLLASAGSCTRSLECVEKNGGRPAVCRAVNHTCVPVDSEDCHAEGAIDFSGSQAEPVWFGAMSSRDPGPVAQAVWNTFDLARRDFNAVGGIPGVAEGETHPIGVVGCDSHGDIKRAATHLAALGVPVVIGFAMPTSKEIAVATDVFIPNRIMMLDFMSTSPLIPRIPQPANVPRLVWSATCSAEELAFATAQLTAYVEKSLRHSNAVPVAKDIKLAIVRSDADFALTVSDSAVSVLRINGKSLEDVGDNFRQFTFHLDPKTAPAHETDKIVANLTKYAPNIIIYPDGEIFFDAFVSKIEAGWSARNRPMYLSVSAYISPALVDFVGRSAERRHRFLAVDLPANTAENLKFVLHYNDVFKPPITPGIAPGVAYDTFYEAAYAAAAARKSSLTGVDLAQSMSLFNKTGTPIAIGPSTIFSVFAALRDKNSVNLTGAGSTLNFKSNGVVALDLSVDCLGVDPDGNAFGPIESGLRVHSGVPGVDGVMHCP